MSEAIEGSAEALYLKRVSDRDTYVQEAYRSALVTIPSVFPDTDDVCQRTSPVTLAKPFQSLGARGINNLSSKLLLTLFPPTLPFMKYVLSAAAKSEAKEDATELADLEALLSRREGTIQDEVDVQNIRTKAFALLRQLLVAGNALGFADPATGGLQVFPLNAFTTVRDGRGRLLDLIYVEKMDRTSVVDDRVTKILDETPTEAKGMQGASDTQKPVLMFTRVLRDGKTFLSWQEVNGQRVPDSEEEWKEDALPWLALRYTAIDGEHYGRGFVEEYRGDLTAYEQLSRDTQFASANAAKVVWAIDPTSGLKVAKFLDTPNGGAVSGKGEDIVAIRLDKGGDMQFVAMEKRELQQGLAAAFLLNSSFQRSGERVTAEEIRRMAEELEDTLGGVFSLLSTELQLPLARLLEVGLIKRGEMKELPKEAARIGVVTGLAAIGRGQELQRLREAAGLMGELAQIFPGLPDYVIESNLNTRIWTGTGVDTEGLLKTEEEVAEERQARQEAAGQQTLGDELAKGAGKVAGNVPPEVAAQALSPQE